MLNWTNYMHIIWHGQSFFELWTKDREGNRIKIAIDPFDESLGLKLPKVSSDILLISHPHPDHSNKKAVSGNPFLIAEPGEYEVKGIFVQGIPSFHDNCQGKERGENIMSKLEIKGMKLCHLGDLGQKELNPEQVEALGDIDILMIPVGGTYTIGAKEASTIISQIEPKIVIPMHYKIPKLNLKIDSPEKFLKIMGAEATEPQKKLKVKAKDLAKEETKIVVLTPA